MTTTTEAPWWHAAPNPECAPWCAGGHAPDEFSIGAGFLCTRPIEAFATDGSAVEVELVQYQGGQDDPGVVQQFPAEVWMRVGRGDLSLTFAEAIEFGERLSVAAHKARAIAEGRA